MCFIKHKFLSHFCIGLFNRIFAFFKSNIRTKKKKTNDLERVVHVYIDVVL